VEGFVLDGHGATIYLEKPGHALSLYKCKDITVRNLTFDWDPLLYCQGKVADLTGETMTVQLDPGYAVPANVGEKKGPRAMLFDAQGDLKALQRGFTLSGREDLGDGQVRFRVWGFYGVKARDCGIEVGDPIAIWNRQGRAVIAEVCDRILLEDITLYGAGFVGFVGHVGEGPIVFRRCKILRRPGTNRLVGGNADGFNVSNMRHGPVLEDCVIENIGDDFVNIHGSYYRVFVQESPTQIVAQRFASYGVEKPALTFISPDKEHRFLGDAVAASVENITYTVPATWQAETWHANKNFKPGEKLTAARITLAAPIDLGKDGAMFSSSSAVCAGAVVLNCEFRGSLARGIRLQSIDAVIEDNTIRRVLGPGLTFAGHPGFWGEATNSRNVLVKGNRFVENAFGDERWGRAAIAVYTDGSADGADLVRDIRIVGNEIVRPAGSGISLNNCRDVVIRDNTIRGYGALPYAPRPGTTETFPGYGESILNRASTNTVIEANTVTEPGPHAVRADH
jgi:hypothetical protein